MTSKPLLVFDFDGVIVDGMCEYWWSARQSCIELLSNRSNSHSLPNSVPAAFVQLRPWVNQGWEMVLLAAEMLRTDSPLLLQGATVFSETYHLRCQEALEAWHWHPENLQTVLEDVRRYAIANDPTNWLSRHKPFPGVLNRLKQLNTEKLTWAVLTTKSADFTNELLNHFRLKPDLIYGHESGNKPSILLQLKEDWSIRGFIEDRRATLEKVLNTPGLQSVPCYLASWGYLKPQDLQDLPPEIHLLRPETLATPLASWL